MIGDAGNGADGVHVGDINQDGFQDVVSGWEESGEMMLYQNPGADIYTLDRWPAVNIGAGLPMRGIEDAAFADLNGDGAIDAVISSVEGWVQRLAVHRWTGPLLDPDSWRAEVLTADQFSPYMKARAASLGPGPVDIVAGSREGGTSEPGIYWFRDTGKGWQRIRIGDVDFKTTGLTLIDMDQDGWKDVLFAGRNELVWLRNPGGNSDLAWSRHLIAEGVSEFTLCDLAQDGQLDIVAGTSRHSDTLARWFYRLPDDSGWGSWPIAVPGGRTNDGSEFVIKGIACGDLNHDGNLELVFTTSGDGHGVFSLAHGGHPDSNETWTMRKHIGYMNGIKYDNVELIDLDNDGDLDIVTSEEGDNVISLGLGVLWFENPLIDRSAGLRSGTGSL